MVSSLLARFLFLLLFWRSVVAIENSEDDSSNHAPLVHRTVEISLDAFEDVSSGTNSIGRRMLHHDDSIPDHHYYEEMIGSNVLRVKLDKDKTMTFQARFRNEEHWYGDCIDGSGASANFIVSREDNKSPPRLIGSIRTGNGDTQYRVSMNAESGKLVALATEGAGRLEERALQGEELPEEAPEQERSSFSMTQLSSDASFSVDEDATTRVDILVAYTRNAMCAAANQPYPWNDCRDTPQNRQFILDIIKIEVASTNLAFELSGVTTRLNLVKTWMDPDYDEVRDADFFQYNKILTHLDTKNDGYLDDVHEIRDEYGADLVAMMVASSQYCGMAWLYSSAESAFSLTTWFCNSFTFAHEIGTSKNCGGFVRLCIGRHHLCMSNMSNSFHHSFH